MKSDRDYETQLALAVKLVRQLDGVPINKARDALEHAIVLLSTTQIVQAESSLLVKAR